MERTVAEADLADRLTDVLNRVRDGEQFAIERDGDVVAVLMPPQPKPGITGAELLARLGDLRLPGDGFADDLDAIQRSQPMMRPLEWPERSMAGGPEWKPKSTSSNLWTTCPTSWIAFANPASGS